jgi:hypothetical protein
MVTKTRREKHGSKKGKIVLPFQITYFFGNQWPYHKSNPLQHAFLEDLVLHVAKGLLTSIFCWKSMVAMFGFAAMWACIVSIPLPNGD